RWGTNLLHRTGVLWMAGTADDEFERSSIQGLKDSGIPYEELSAGEMAKRWPQVNFEDVPWGIFEPKSGYLMARTSCQAVAKAFINEGGEYRQAAVSADAVDSGKWEALKLEDGSRLQADQYVFACGPWLPKLFPETVAPHFQVSRQEIFFFGAPAG